MLDNPNEPVSDLSYFDCIESVMENSKVSLSVLLTSPFIVGKNLDALCRPCVWPLRKAACIRSPLLRCFSNLTAHLNHLGVLSNTDWLPPATTPSFWYSRSGVGLSLCISDRFPDPAHVAQGPRSENHCLYHVTDESYCESNRVSSSPGIRLLGKDFPWS